MWVITKAAEWIVLGSASCVAQSGESAHAPNQPKLEKMAEFLEARSALSVIVLLVGQAEKTNIIEDSADHLKELCS